MIHDLDLPQRLFSGLVREPLSVKHSRATKRLARWRVSRKSYQADGENEHYLCTETHFRKQRDNPNRFDARFSENGTWIAQTCETLAVPCLAGYDEQRNEEVQEYLAETSAFAKPDLSGDIGCCYCKV